MDMMDNFKGSYEKPPLGLKPTKYWMVEVYKDRQLEILAAMERYVKAEKIVPEEWIIELKMNNEILLHNIEYVELDIAEKDVERFKNLMKKNKLEVFN